MTNITANQIGFYDRPNQPVDQPTYNPPLDAPCPFCGAPLTMDDMRTISLLYIGGARSYFYRTHRTCHEAALPGERDALDGLAFAAVEALPSGWRDGEETK
jgi:hypothetical protein